MPVETMRYYPDEELSQVCEPVTDFLSEEFFDLLDALEDSLLHYRGVGLAANQIGVTKRAFALDESKLRTNYADEEDFQQTQEAPVRVFINPEIIAQEGEALFDEGCLSMPSVSFKVPRSTYIKIRAQDGSGESFEYEATGYHAAAIQHEMDHLDGKMHFMRSSGVSRRMAMKKYRQFQKTMAKVMRLRKV